MNKIIRIEYLDGYKFLLHFNDDASKIIDFKNLIGKGISAELLNIEYFKLVRIDNGGGIEWPNSFDFCPIYLREYVLETEAVI